MSLPGLVRKPGASPLALGGKGDRLTRRLCAGDYASACDLVQHGDTGAARAQQERRWGRRRVSRVSANYATPPPDFTS
jgi:hypothetical protein